MDKSKEMTGRKKKTPSTLLDKQSKVYKAFLAMANTTYCDGELTKKVKELIAIGISVVISCESCMEWHIGQAVRAGAGEKEILEAIEVGIVMGGGPATANARFALEVLESLDFS